ncbi:flocculation-associated PEP-CTERM protein PepA [Pseudoduganella sp. R-34]|uniref:flocculation-associated PEP-CTERM protein PepA n=1 Tax=unclassified Pseudoduganella TaxID=2637179 RepID=UPI003CF55A2F
MKIFRKLLPLATVAGLLFAAGAAQADVITPFTIKDGTNVLATNVNSLDWAETGSGLAKGIGPFGAPLAVGTKFDFLYQATLVGKAGGTGSPSLGGRLDGEANGSADGLFEITIAARMTEVVSSVVPGPGGTATANFNLAPGQNQVAIYFDTNQNANTATGVGFDDGIMIALLTIDTNSSVFQLLAPNNGQGSARLHAGMLSPGDFIDANYLEGVTSLLFGIDFQSSLNYPADTSTTTGFHRNGSSNNGDPFATDLVAGNDILFKVDGSNRFTRVPEPGTMLLMGIGLLGLARLRRRA